MQLQMCIRDSPIPDVANAVFVSWKPGDNSSRIQRAIDYVSSLALDNKWGTVKVLRYSWPGRIAEAGLENLTLASDYDKKYLKDEDHCWTGVSIENAENCWVRRVNFKHFAGSAVIVQRTGCLLYTSISSVPCSCLIWYVYTELFLW